MRRSQRKFPPLESGQRFNRLVAVKYAGTNDKGRPLWLFRCDCGNLLKITTVSVRVGNTRSCGCLKIEILSGQTPKNKTHGLAKSVPYRIWNQMMMRCTNPASISYPNYGGRGIKVCERWQKFANFYADMYPKPSSAHTLDRINNDGNYGPSNCRWATWKEQAANKRNNRIIEFNGERMHISEAARRYHLKEATVRARIDVSGWSIERALTEPLRVWRKNAR